MIKNDYVRGYYDAQVELLEKLIIISRNNEDNLGFVSKEFLKEEYKKVLKIIQKDN
jgi:hypothetical protein